MIKYFWLNIDIIYDLSDFLYIIMNLKRWGGVSIVH